MSLTFTKLFTSITESTIWSEDDQTRLVWITMLAMADRRGRVWGSIPGLANRARVSVEACERALDKFKQPDKYSRTSNNEGRRVEDMDGGWVLLNHGKYRAIRDAEAIKESKRISIAKKRARVKSENVDSNVEKVDRSRANAEADTESDNIKTARTTKVVPTDEEWLNGLKTDPTYSHLNVAVEYGKMMRWCETAKKKPSRRRFINWINRAEVPLDSGVKRSGYKEATYGE